MLLACFQPVTGVLSRRKEKDTDTWRQDEPRTKRKDDHQQAEERGLSPRLPTLGSVGKQKCCLGLTGGHRFSDTRAQAMHTNLSDFTLSIGSIFLPEQNENAPWASGATGKDYCTQISGTMLTDCISL